MNRKRITINATTSFVEVLALFPTKMIIKRIRVEAQAPATQVAIQIREKSNPNSILDIPLEYPLTATPLDDETYTFVEALKINAKPIGKLWIAAKVDAPALVTVQIEYISGKEILEAGTFLKSLTLKVIS